MNKKITLFSILLAALVLAACGQAAPGEEDGPAEGLTVRPVSEIVDTDILVTNFASNGTATLPVDTAVPVACSVVYGTTPEFGQLSVDSDMAGGSHQEHNPLLTGLQPDTLYYFRLQGVDDNGVLYVSEVMTFRTPPADPEQESLVNLASPEMGAQITGYSSAFGGAAVDERWGAGSAFDGDPSTEWSSAGDGDAAWIEVTLAKPARITGIQFQTRSMSDGSAIARAFTVTTESGEVLGPFELPDAGQPYTFETAFEAQTLRFELIETTGGNTGAVDIAVFGEFIEP